MRYFRKRRDPDVIHDGATFGDAGQPPDWAAELWEEVHVVPVKDAIVLPQAQYVGNASWEAGDRTWHFAASDDLDRREQRLLARVAAARAERRRRAEQEAAKAKAQREAEVETMTQDVVDMYRQLTGVELVGSQRDLVRELVRNDLIKEG